MGALTKVQLIVGNLQFIGMLRSINLPFPTIYINFSSFSNLISINPAFIQSINANIPVLTFRLLFIAVAILFPCMVMVFTTLVFVNYPTIQWSAYSLISLFLATMLIVIKYTPSYAPLTLDVTSPFFLYTTIASCAYCVLFKSISYFVSKKAGSIVRYFVKQLLSPAMLFAGSALARFSSDTLRVVFCICMLMCFSFSYKSSIAQGAKVFSLLLFAGLGTWFWLKSKLDPSVSFPSALTIPGYVLIVMSGLGWIQFLLRSNDDKSFGRVFATVREKIQHLLDKGLLAVSFFFLSSAFVPVVTYSLQNWVCRTFECAVGNKFNPYVPSSLLTDMNLTAMCDPCNFDSQQMCNYSSTRLCPRFSEQRLAFFPDTMCSDKGALFFKIASIVVLVVFVPLISFMYFKVISVITATLTVAAQKTFRDLQADFAGIQAKRAARAAEQQREMQLEALLQQDPFLDRRIDLSMSQLVSGTPLQQGHQARMMSIPPSSSSPPLPENSQWQSPLLVPPSSFDPFADITQDPLEMTTTLPNESMNRTRAASTRSRSKTLVETLGIMVSKQSQEELEDKLKPPTMEDAVSTASARIVPRAGCLYNEFRRGQYYFLFVVNTHRLALVIINVFIAPFHGYAALLNLVVNAIVCVVQTAARPYQHAMEQRLSFIVLFAMVLNSLYATLLWQYPDNKILLSDAMSICLVVTTGGIPLICAVAIQIMSMLDTFRNPYAKVEKERRKKDSEERKRAKEQLEYEITTAEAFEEEDRIEILKGKLAMLEVKQATYEEKLTDALDNRTKKIIVIFFLLAVPMLLGALGLALWATINAEPPEFADGSSLLDRSAASVLGGRSSWEDFVDTCCVIPSLTTMTGFNLTERWICTNLTSLSNLSSSMMVAAALEVTSPLTISRNRQALVISDGTIIRRYAAVDFEAPYDRCNVTVGDGKVSFQCSEDIISAGKADTYSLSVLW